MKNILAFGVLVLTTNMFAQQTLLFHENFDLPSGPDSVIVASSTGTNPILWNDTNFVSVSPTQSFHLKGSPSATVSFETQAFSSLGTDSLFLSFNHIAKVSSSRACKIYISLNNGTSWKQLKPSTYLGAATVFGSNGFDDGSYTFLGNPWKAGINYGPAAQPDSSWWRPEIFNLSTVARDSVTGVGFPQVKIKFEAYFKYAGGVGNHYLAGWFVDDVKVIKSPCDIIPPVAKLRNTSIQGVFCKDSLMSGAYTYTSNFSEEKYFSISDNLNLDSVRLLEIVNGVPRPIAYKPVNSYGCSHTFTSYTALDTVKWALEAYDTCGNLGRFPATGYHKFYFSGFPSKCGSTPCKEAPQIINTFPWKQDFESNKWVPGFGNGGNFARGTFPTDEFYDIVPPVASNFGWSVRSGSTGTVATGPQRDHTTRSGKYLYTDFDYAQQPVETTYFTLPCIDLRDSLTKTFTFYYHMFGSDINELKVEIDTSPGASAVWNSYVNIVGQQQPFYNDSWRKVFLSLEPFKGKIIKLRISGSRKNGGNLSDIAIDDVEIRNVPSTDFELLKLRTPNFLACYGSTNVPVRVSIFNNGINAPAVLPLAYQLDNNGIHRDTFNIASTTLGDTLELSFNQSLTYNPATSHALKIWSEAIGDTNHHGDTMRYTIPIQQNAVINTFPYMLSFEDAVTHSYGPGKLNDSHWLFDTSATNYGYWQVIKGAQNNTFYGPLKMNGKGNAGLKLNSVGGGGVYFSSSCIDLSNVTNPVLQFQNFVSRPNVLEVVAREDSDDEWVSLGFINDLSTDRNPLEGNSVSLHTFQGKTVQLSFKANNDFSIFSSTIILDDIIIREAPAIDLATRRVDLEHLPENSTNVTSIACDYTYWGNTSNNFYARLKVELINQCDPTASIIYGESDSILLNGNNLPVNNQQVFTNLTFNNPLPAGNYDARYWVYTSGDELLLNDTLYTALTSTRVVTLPYFEDFENCFTGAITEGKMGQWEIDTVIQDFGPGSIYGGLKCVSTNTDYKALTDTNEFEILRLPAFGGLDTLYGAELRLHQYFDFGSGNYAGFGAVQIFDGSAGWISLDDPTLTTHNWNTYINSISNPTIQKGFTGKSGPGWTYSTYPLSQFKNQGLKSIRFLISSPSYGHYWGWALDDIEIHVPPQNSASPQLLLFNHKAPAQGNNQMDIKVKNTGSAPLDELDVIIEEKGNIILQERIILNPPLFKNQSKTVAISQPLLLSSSMKEIVVRTYRPNRRTDEITSDDTLKIPLHFLAEVDSIPQCFGFENNSSFLAFDANLGTFDTTWQKGIPNKTQINAAHTGSDAWFTSTSLYGRLLNQFLLTPFYDVSHNSCYRLSFWQNFDTEKNFDGGNVEFTLDSGLTWQTLGRYLSTDSLWYNIQFVQSLDYTKPGFSGNSGGWIYAQNDFKVFADGAIQFRFRFASNADISGEGWAIDDVCLESTGSNCQTIGLEPKEVVNTKAYLYPVPSSSLLNLRADVNGSHQLVIYDQRGAIVRKWNEELNPTEPSTINIERLAAGVYWLQIENTAAPIILKFIKD